MEDSSRYSVYIRSLALCITSPDRYHTTAVHMTAQTHVWMCQGKRPRFCSCGSYESTVSFSENTKHDDSFSMPWNVNSVQKARRMPFADRVRRPKLRTLFRNVGRSVLKSGKARQSQNGTAFSNAAWYTRECASKKDLSLPI